MKNGNPLHAANSAAPGTACSCHVAISSAPRHRVAENPSSHAPPFRTSVRFRVRTANSRKSYHNKALAALRRSCEELWTVRRQIPRLPLSDASSCCRWNAVHSRAQARSIIISAYRAGVRHPPTRSGRDRRAIEPPPLKRIVKTRFIGLNAFSSRVQRRFRTTRDVHFCPTSSRHLHHSNGRTGSQGATFSGFPAKGKSRARCDAPLMAERKETAAAVPERRGH